MMLWGSRRQQLSIFLEAEVGRTRFMTDFIFHSQSVGKKPIRNRFFASVPGRIDF